MNYEKLYLSWVNDFITLGAFAEYYNLHPLKALRVLAKGRAIHQSNFGSIL